MEVTLATLAASVPPGVFPEGAVGGWLGLAGGFAAGTVPVVLGITDLIMGDGDEEPEEDGAVFDDDGGDLDDIGGLDDDGLDGLDDDGLEGFDDDQDALGGGGSGDISEVENRLEELENEVASLSSTVNTVQSENEAVSETVQEVEENVRDLLEIYEMVTRGVNPFVDDAASGTMGGDVGGDFGLFDDDGDDGDDDVDDSIAEADAEEFFEDDFDEPGGDEFADPDDAAMVDDGGGMDDTEEFFEDDFDEPGDDEFGDDAAIPDDGGMDDAIDDESETGSDDGKSFEELKQEYESGDPDWDVDDPMDDEEGDDPVGEGEAGFGDDLDDPLGEGEAGFGDDLDDPMADDGTEFGDGPPEEDGEDDSGDDEFEFVGERGEDVEGGRDGRLHLQEFPEGYRADMTALEWLEYLIGVGGSSGARDALSYYVDVGWISPAVEDTLHAFLDGMHVSNADGERSDPGGLARFSPEDHRKSLAYVARLAGDDGSELDPTDGPDSVGGDGDGI